MMWMFPGAHQYLPRMGVGMGAAAAMPSMPRMPFMAPQPVVPSPPVNPLSPGYRAHMPAAVGITEPYAHYLGVNHLQPTPTQVSISWRHFSYFLLQEKKNVSEMFGQHFAQGVGYYPLGAKAVQQNPAALHMPPNAAAAAAVAPGVLPPESAPDRGPGTTTTLLSSWDGWCPQQGNLWWPFC